MKTAICSKIEIRRGQHRINFLCDECQNEASERQSHFNRKQRHFCSMKCYAANRRTWQASEQPTWRGGVSNTEAHQRWKAKNPERMAHLKARRYARERNAEGSHTLEQWKDLKTKHNNRCANCKEEKPLTKDHIIPLARGGSDYIENIQPLCRNCNSRKWIHIHENPELLKV